MARRKLNDDDYLINKRLTSYF